MRANSVLRKSWLRPPVVCETFVHQAGLSRCATATGTLSWVVRKSSSHRSASSQWAALRGGGGGAAESCVCGTAGPAGADPGADSDVASEVRTKKGDAGAFFSSVRGVGRRECGGLLTSLLPLCNTLGILLGPL